MTSEEQEERRQWISQSLHRHLDKIGAREYYHKDPTFHTTMTFMKAFLAQTDIAMETHQIPREVRDDIIDLLVFGCVSPGEMINMDMQQMKMQEDAELLRTAFGVDGLNSGSFVSYPEATRQQSWSEEKG